jgi:anti-anti-sigma factor
MTDDQFSVTTGHAQAGPVLTIDGDLDAVTAPEVLTEIENLNVERGQLLVVNLERVTFCDSSGISALIAARNLAQAAGGSIALAAVPAQLARTLGMLGLDSFFPRTPG